MATKISLRDANQRFAKLVREVESGREFVVTRRGGGADRPDSGKARADGRAGGGKAALDGAARQGLASRPRPVRPLAAP